MSGVIFSPFNIELTILGLLISSSLTSFKSSFFSDSSIFLSFCLLPRKPAEVTSTEKSISFDCPSRLNDIFNFPPFSRLLTVKISIDNTTPLPDIAPISSISPGEWMFNFTPISEGLNGISHCSASENAACSLAEQR